MTARFIGIQHRVKFSVDGEPRPTKLSILTGEEFIARDLETEQDELDFVLTELRAGDTVAFVLGGSGDYLAYATARRADEVGAKVFRIPPFVLKKERSNQQEPARSEPVTKKKSRRGSRPSSRTDGDHNLLARLARDKAELFYELAEVDRNLILARESWRALWEVMQARMAAYMRLRQLTIGRIFTDPQGLYPEGGIEKQFDQVKASDVIFNALVGEESRRAKELEKALEKLKIYRELFKPIKGVGPKIAGRLIAAIIDIRRFETAPALKAFCGVHVLPDGRFPRKRTGEVANWHGDARQALVLLGEQFNRRPDSLWGKYLLKMKTNLRAAHPEPILAEVPDKENGGTKTVTRYSDGHIHSMALWRTSTRFVEWLHKEWWRLEREDSSARRARAT